MYRLRPLGDGWDSIDPVLPLEKEQEYLRMSQTQDPGSQCLPKSEA